MFYQTHIYSPMFQFQQSEWTLSIGTRSSTFWTEFYRHSRKSILHPLHQTSLSSKAAYLRGSSSESL